jgi:hypothetical protein
MKGQDLFAAGVRLFGVWMLVRCMEYVSAAFTLNFVFKVADDTANSPKGMMSYAAFHLGMAAFFLLGTRQLTSWTYGQDSSKTAPEASEEGLA